MDLTRKRAIGRIHIKNIDQTPYDDSGGPKILEIKATEEFRGDLAGMGEVRFLFVSRADGSASFAGVERFKGTLDGREGTLILQNSGTLENGEVNGTWFVVPRSGTDGFDGLRGEGGFQTAIGFFLDYWFE
jgi:Protein of unknown function (DUF3224)